MLNTSARATDIFDLDLDIITTGTVIRRDNRGLIPVPAMSGSTVTSCVSTGTTATTNWAGTCAHTCGGLTGSPCAC